MALEELRDGDASGLSSLRPSLEDAQKRFHDMRSEIDKSLADLFAKHDANTDAATLGEIRAALDRRRYVSNLLRDVGKALE